MRPYTDEELVRLAGSGVKRLVVLCPAFVPIASKLSKRSGMRGRDSFLEAGGESLTLVPCMNEHPSWLQALERMVTSKWSDAAAAQGSRLRAQGLSSG